MSYKVATSLIAALCLAGCALPVEFKENGVASGGCVIDHGSAFGIAIGDGREVAHKVLGERYGQFKFIYSNCMTPGYSNRPDGSTYRKDFSPVDCQGHELADVYHDSTGPGMTVENIEIISQDGRVTRIEWWMVRTYFG